MAHGIKYFFEYKDRKLSDTWRVELLLDSYASTQYEIDAAAPDPEVIRDLGGDAHERSRRVIRGTEAEFTFLVTQADNHKYDEIATSNYKQWILKRYKNGSLIFQGYVKPEHVTRGYVENVGYYISVATSCGLGDLKSIEFLNSSGDLYSDRVSALTIIKRCIEAGDLPELDFKIQLNTYETALMTSSECALEVVTYDCRRFFTNVDGRTKPWKCHEVIEYVLKFFHVSLQQVDGYYYIWNPREYNSYIYEFDFATLTEQSRTLSNLLLDTQQSNGYEFIGKGVKSWVRPLRRLEIKFENKNLGDDESSNGDFQSGTTTGWTNDNWDTWTIDINGTDYFLVTVNNTTGTTIRSIHADSFNIATFTAGDKIKITWKVRLESILFSGTPPPGQGYPQVYAGLQKSGGPLYTGTKRTILEADGWIEFIDYFDITSTGDYTVYFYVEPQETVTFMRYYWNDISFNQQRQADEITYDRVFIFDNSVEAFDEHEEVVKFGDSLQSSDIGALKIGGTLTGSWNRYGESDSLPILTIFGLETLSDFQVFGGAFDVTIKDDNDTIRPFSALVLKGIGSEPDITCEIIAYQRNQKKRTLELTLREIKTADATYTFNEQYLTTVDGQKSGSSEVPVSVPSYWQQGVSGIYSINNVAIGMVPTGTYQLEVNGDGYFDGDLEVTGTITQNGTAVSLAGHTHALDDLSDVSITSPSTDQVLQYNGSAWVNAALAGGGGGTVTEVTVGTGLDVADGTTTPAVTLDLSELSEKTGDLVGTDRLVIVSGTAQYAETISEIPLSIFDNDLGAGGAPAGTDGQVQYNNGGSFGGAAGIYYDDTTGNLGLNTTDLEAWDSAYRAIEFPGSAIYYDYSNGNGYISLLNNVYNDGSFKYKTSAAAAILSIYSGTFLYRFTSSGTANGAITWTTGLKIDNSGVITVGVQPSSGDSADEILLRDVSTGAITKLGIGTNLTVSGGNLNAASAGGGTVTEVTVGTGLDVADGTTTPNITLSLDELSEKTGTLVGTDKIVGLTGPTHFAETINQIPLSIFNNDSGWTSNAGTVTSISVGTGLDVATATTTPSITLDLSELAEKTGDLVGTDRLVIVSGTAQYAETISQIPLSIFDNDLGAGGSPGGSDGQIQYNNGGSFGGGSGFYWNDTSSRIGINISSPSATFHLSADGNTVNANLISTDELIFTTQSAAIGLAGIVASSTSSHRAVFKGTRAGGAIGSPSAPASGDYVLSILGAIYDGSNNNATAGIEFFVDGTVSTGNAPQRIEFKTGTTTSRTTRLTITSAGVIEIDAAPAAGDSSDEILLRDATSGAITKLGIGTNLSVSGGDLNAAAGASYWTQTGSHIYYNTGFVGIGDDITGSSQFGVYPLVINEITTGELIAIKIQNEGLVNGNAVALAFQIGDAVGVSMGKISVKQIGVNDYETTFYNYYTTLNEVMSFYRDDVYITNHLLLNNSKYIYFGTTLSTDFILGFNGTNGVLNMRAEGDLLLQDDGSTKFTFDLAGTGSGTLTCTDVVSTSDIRHKENIEAMSSDWIDKVNQIGQLAKSFNWKDDFSLNRSRQYGFIAQDLIGLADEFLKTDSEGFYSVNYSKMIAPTMFAVSSLIRENKTLKKEIETLKSMLI